MTPREYALAYAELGWPVFPLKARSKAPATPNGFHDAHTDAERIDAWWTRHPDHGIGIATGAALDILDIDHTGYLTDGDGTDDLPDCETDGGPVVRTGAGKCHLYFAPSGTRRQIKVWQHCDWLGEGGYVVAPPSIHPDTGLAYEWYSSYQLALTSPPEALLAIVKPPPSTPLPPPGAWRADERPRREINKPRWNPDGLIGRVLRSPEGSRNETLNWAAHRIGADVRDNKATRDEADEALRDLERAALAAGLDGREVTSTIRSGYSAGEQGASA